MSCIIFKGIRYEKDEIERQKNEIKGILSGLPLAQNEPVALFMERNVKMLVTIYALYEVGIPFIPLDIHAPRERNQNILSLSGAKYCITNISYEFENAVNLDINCTYESLEIKDFNNHMAYIIPTSGTTGEPKLVQIGRNALEKWLQDFSEMLKTKYRCTICMSDYMFDMFMIEVLYSAYIGMDIVLAGEDEQKNPMRLSRLIKENSVDFIQATPSRMRLIGTMDRSFKCLDGVSCISLGGERIGKELFARLKEKNLLRIINIYGPTETTVCCICGDLTNSDEEYLGSPLKHSRIYLLDDNMKQVHMGQTGEICVAGECICDGYKNNAEAQKRQFTEWNNIRLYKTGDLAYINDRGMYVYAGRKDNQIKLRGYRIELEEIEHYIMEIENIREAVVCVWEGKEELAAYYISDDKCNVDERGIIAYLKQKLPEYMIPYRYIRMEEFPITLGGKADRKGLCMQGYNKTGGEGTGCYGNSISVNDINKIIISLIKQKADRGEEITKDSKLTDIGMDSISYMEVIVEIEEKYGFKFEDDKLSFKEITTVGELAEYVGSMIEKKGGV